MKSLMKSRTGMWIFVVCLFSTLAIPILFAAQNGKNHQPTFTTFDPPDSAATFPQSINPAGAITGGYSDVSDSDNLHGFLRAPNGTITTFDVPGAAGSRANSINPAGEITGAYVDASFVTHGFLRARDGTFTTFDPPGSLTTTTLGINPAGAITGYYQDSTSFNFHGFVRY